MNEVKVMKCRYDHIYKQKIYCEDKNSIFYHEGCIGYGCCPDFISVPGDIRDEIKVDV